MVCFFLGCLDRANYGGKRPVVAPLGAKSFANLGRFFFWETSRPRATLHPLPDYVVPPDALRDFLSSLPPAAFVSCTSSFFVFVLGLETQKVREAVTRQPRLLGMSLEMRLRPRLQIIRKAGFTPSWELHHGVSCAVSCLIWLRRHAPHVHAHVRNMHMCACLALIPGR